MNKIRRAQIQKLIGKIDEVMFDLEDIQYDEESARDSIPENLQGSERYEKAEEACDNLESAMDYLEEVKDYLEEAIA